MIISLLLLSGIVTCKSWAGEEILPYTAPLIRVIITGSGGFEGEGIGVTVGEEFTFEDDSTDTDLKITWEETEEGYKYNFQREAIDGTITNVTGDGTYCYTQPGTYTITYTVYADHDEETSITITVTVHPAEDPEDPEDPIGEGGGPGGPGGDGDGDEAPTVNITNFTAGHLPYNSTPKITTFITSSETSCAIAATAMVTPAAASVSWEATVPDGWSPISGGTGTSFSQTATVPTHPDGGRPANMKITLKATATHQNKTASSTVSATQDAIDWIRQEYVDHAITIPGQGDFSNSGSSAHFSFNELKSKDPRNLSHAIITDALFDGLEATRTNYGYPMVPSSGYRNPEHNEREGGKWRSQHQYGVAADIRVRDLNRNGIIEYSEWRVLERAAKAAGAWTDTWEKTGTWVHMDWGH